MFSFDFAALAAADGNDEAADAAVLGGAARAELVFPAGGGGHECNAVASWFELDLTGDGSVRLTTSPYAAHSNNGAAAAAAAAAPAYAPSWQQAVHPLPPRAGRAGDRLAVSASHDTYSIRFGWRDTTGGAPSATADATGATDAGGQQEAPAASGAAADPAWAQLRGEVSALQAALQKQAAQQPQRHRGVVAAALELAARPVGGGADPGQAVRLCASLMM